mgnify:CR=1 FL=1
MNVEDAPELVLGQRYRVRCVRTDGLHYWPKWIPVLGPLHEDAAIIDFPEDHWHIDWRFAPASFFDFTRCRVHPLGQVISKRNTRGGLVRHALVYKREMPEFPNYAHWLPELEAAHADDRLKPGLVCPHRGISLKGCPHRGGVIVCPGHGLAWDVTTGRLVRREKGERPWAR